MKMTSTFKNLLKIELTKAIKNKFFVTTLIIGLVFTLFSAWYRIDLYQYTQWQLNNSGGNQMTQAFNLYNNWIGGEAISLGFVFFFTLLPLLAVMPYGWSYYIENKTGYVKAVVTRSSKREYFLTKYIATFIAGGLVILIPLVVNFVVVALFVPAVTPTISYAVFCLIRKSHMASQMYYTYPILCVLLYLILDFIFAASVDTLTFTVT